MRTTIAIAFLLLAGCTSHLAIAHPTESTVAGSRAILTETTTWTSYTDPADSDGAPP